MDHNTAAIRIRSLYDDGGDPSFRMVLDLAQPNSEGELAAVIEVDGRLRLALGRDVGLDRYLDAVSLTEQQTALDAAIDIALRSRSRSSVPGRSDVEALVRNYPQLEQSIREAAKLGIALGSTTTIIDRWAPGRRTPCELGPHLEDGRRRYELIEQVGEGATGVVYRAVDRNLSDTGAHATVAVKIFHRPEDPALAQWLREEALKARRVNHENVLRALDRGDTDEGESFIVYEFVEGGDLGELIRQCGLPMPARRAARLVADVANGVQAIHTAGLVHCDLKPGNIALTEEGKPKVADFGIAMREGQAPSVELGQPGTPVGTYAFIAPEQFNCSPGAYSFPADIYSLGAMLAFLVNGELPNGMGAREVAERHARPRPVMIGGEHDRDLRRIIARATAPEPSQRYPSASALAEDLDRWLHRRPLTWGRTGPVRRARLFMRRRPVLAAVTAVAIFAAGIAAGVKVREDLRRAEAIALLEALLPYYVENDHGGENLHLLSAWEQFAGGAFFDGIPLALHKYQIEMLRKLWEASQQDGEISSDGMMFGSGLALALVSRQGDYLEGGPLAAECRKRWVRLFGESDPMARRLAVVIAAAEVNRLLAEHDRGTPIEPEAVAAARTALEAAGGQLPERDANGPIYRLYETKRDSLDALQLIAVAAG